MRIKKFTMFVVLQKIAHALVSFLVVQEIQSF